MNRRKWLWVPLVTLGMAVYFLLMYSAGENALRSKKAEGITFLSGGLSEPERRNLEEMGRNYSLKVIFANGKGEYLSEVTVTIFDQEGQSILTTVSNGPWFFINLPSGIYDLEASFQKSRKRIPNLKIDEKNQTAIGIQW